MWTGTRRTAQNSVLPQAPLRRHRRSRPAARHTRPACRSTSGSQVRVQLGNRLGVVIAAVRCRGAGCSSRMHGYPCRGGEGRPADLPRRLPEQWAHPLGGSRPQQCAQRCCRLQRSPPQVLLAPPAVIPSLTAHLRGAPCADPGLEGEYQARAAERSWASDLQWVALRVSPEGEARPARHRGVVHKRRRSCPQPCWPLLCYSLLPPCHPPGAAGMLRVCTPGVPAQQQPS